MYDLDKLWGWQSITTSREHQARDSSLFVSMPAFYSRIGLSQELGTKRKLPHPIDFANAMAAADAALYQAKGHFGKWPLEIKAASRK